MVLLDTDSDCVPCSREWSCGTFTMTVYSVVGNRLLDTDSDCILYSSGTFTEIMYSIAVRARSCVCVFCQDLYEIVC